jgi:hypothetical protein
VYDRRRNIDRVAAVSVASRPDGSAAGIPLKSPKCP